MAEENKFFQRYMNCLIESEGRCRRYKIDLRGFGLLRVITDLQSDGYREFPRVEGGIVIYTNQSDPRDVAVLSHLGWHEETNPSGQCEEFPRIGIDFMRVFDDSREVA